VELFYHAKQIDALIILEIEVWSDKKKINRLNKLWIDILYFALLCTLK